MQPSGCPCTHLHINTIEKFAVYVIMKCASSFFLFPPLISYLIMHRATQTGPMALSAAITITRCRVN